MNKLMIWYKKLKDLIGHGRTSALIKGFLFVNFSILFGIWLGIKVFLPDDFILSKINERLFLKDKGLVAEDVDVSLLGNISIYEGALTEKGEKATSFYELQFRPSIIDLMFGEISGTVYLDDINNQGGEIEISFETGENPCYSAELDEAPLSAFKSFLTDISLIGSVTGEAKVCQNEKKAYEGFIELSGKDVVFRGKVPTQMGPINIGKVDIGTIDFVSEIEKSVLTIEKFITEGLFSIDVAGKVTVNSKRFDSTGLNLDVRIKAPDSKKLEKNPTLNLAVGQMSKYKKEKDRYAFLVKGRIAKPRMLNAPDKRVMKTGKVKKDKKDKKEQKKIKNKNRTRPKNKRPVKRERKKPVRRKRELRPPDKDLPKRKKDITERSSTRKLEDDIDEEKKDKKAEKEEAEKEEAEKEEIEKEEVEKEEVEKEENQEETEPEEEEEKDKPQTEELPDTQKKEVKSGEESEDDEEE